MAEQVKIFDTTLRDGEQSPGFSMNVSEKIRVAKKLEALGVDIIEAGFPVASQGDFEAVHAIASEIKQSCVAALARANSRDIDRAWEAVRDAARPVIHTFISSSDIHLQHQLKKSRTEVLDMAVKAVERAKSYTDTVEFSAMDATRSDRTYLARMIGAAISAGATTVNIPDTVGYAIPDEFGDLIRYLMENVPNIGEAIISVHCHNDLGLAVANSLAAVTRGARQVECTVNGIGERAGNTALEEIVMALKVRKDLIGLDTGIRTEQIYPTSRLISSITGIRVQPNKAVVGANAFAHESGIHQDGLLKDKTTYEIMTPETIGLGQSTLVLGKHSGRHAFRDRVKSLGYDLTEEQLGEAFQLFKNLCDLKKEVYDEDIEAIIADEVIQIPDKYRLTFLSVTSGSELIPTATVQMEIEGEVFKAAELGNGPVDAAFKTIKKICRDTSRLIRYEVDAITGGTDAQGAVSCTLEKDGLTVIGRGRDTDIIVASAKAYINALNKLDYKQNYLASGVDQRL
ncbi:MAG: 2-isopropylmalate synthase [Deltaproteobacteria bacterium]|nr:2-isopropylmalate synthase [Deltaproteobacteria bacterium]